MEIGLFTYFYATIAASGRNLFTVDDIEQYDSKTLTMESSYIWRVFTSMFLQYG